MAARAAGIDRWRDGWIVAESDSHRIDLWCTPDIAEAVDRLASHHAVAIDMPIALVVDGRRTAETELRAALGASARSVFTSPTRAAVEASSQSEATVVNRANGGPGISSQAYGLFASIRGLRAALAGPANLHWWETHPETAFAVMNDGVPLAGKRSALGVAQRLNRLRPLFPALDDVLLAAPAKVPIDDVLDALAALWSAGRIAADSARCFGPTGRDDQGFAHGVMI